MPTQADRQRLALVATAVASVGLAALSFRTLNAASRAAAKQVPAADLRSLSAYPVPLPDTSSLAGETLRSIVGESDPFGSPGSPTGASEIRSVPTGTDVDAPRPRWIVSSILFENAKRSAIVNDAWVGVGQLLPDGARVSAIERKYVVVTDSRGKREVVPLQGGRHED